MSIPKNRGRLRNGNWGLKLLSLVLAVVVYYTIKTEAARSGHSPSQQHDRTIFQPR